MQSAFQYELEEEESSNLATEERHLMEVRSQLQLSLDPRTEEVLFPEAYKRFGLAPARAAWLKMVTRANRSDLNKFADLLRIPSAELEALLLDAEGDEQQLVARHWRMCHICARVEATLLCPECEEIKAWVEDALIRRTGVLQALSECLRRLMAWVHAGLRPPELPAPPGHGPTERPDLHPAFTPDGRKLRTDVVLLRIAAWADAGLTPPEVPLPPT